MGPYPVAQLAARIRDIPSVRLVDDLATVAESPRVTPAVFVGLSERAQPSEIGTGVLAQRVSVTLTLMVVVAHAGGASKARQDVAAVQAALREQLLGWQPTGIDAEPLQFGGSSDVRFAGQHLVIQEGYTSEYTIEIEA